MSKIKFNKFIGLKVPSTLAEKISEHAGDKGLSAFIRQSVIEKIERESGEKIAA
jgi:hypothetical protein